MILASLRSFCLFFICFLVVPATAAYSQSAPPQIEAAIRSLQRGDQQALRPILTPRLYEVVARQKDSARYADLRALGAVRKVTARKVAAGRNRGATYDVDVVHERGTSHWTVRVAADGRRIIAADFTTDATRPTVVAAPPISPLPAPSPAAPSGGNVDPSPPLAQNAPPISGPLPRVHVRNQSSGRRPGAVLIDGDSPPAPRAAPSIGAGATPGGGTPAPPAAPPGAPVFPPGSVTGLGAPPPMPLPPAAPVPTPRDAPAAPVSTPAAPPRPTIAAGDRVVDFLFATSRARDTSVETVAFSGQRSRALTYGQASIRIPEDHKIGEITLPSSWKVFGITLSEEKLDEREHFTIRALKTFTLDEWNEAIRLRNPKSALIFVHGYNTSFEDALYRNAQIVWDLRYDGLSVLYSWASWGGTTDYLYDRESAQIGRAGFIEVLRNLKEKHGIESVNVIAHSMGNQVVLDALGNHAQTSNPATIGELILAAPDVDRDMFMSLIPNVQRIVKGITLYASSADKALQASRRLAGVLRAGDIGDDGPIILDNMQTIDVTAMGEEILGLNHNVFAVSRNLIDDIRLLITRGLRPPDQRLSQIRPCPEPAPRYWCFVH